MTDFKPTGHLRRSALCRPGTDRVATMKRTSLLAHLLALLFFLTIPTVLVSIAHHKLVAKPTPLCVDPTGHKRVPCSTFPLREDDD